MITYSVRKISTTRSLRRKPDLNGRSRRQRNLNDKKISTARRSHQRRIDERKGEEVEVKAEVRDGGGDARRKLDPALKEKGDERAEREGRWETMGEGRRAQGRKTRAEKAGRDMGAGKTEQSVAGREAGARKAGRESEQETEPEGRREQEDGRRKRCSKGEGINALDERRWKGEGSKRCCPRRM